MFKSIVPTSAADFVVGLDAELPLRLAHRVHTLLNVPARVPRPPHDGDHALETHAPGHFPHALRANL